VKRILTLTALWLCAAFAIAQAPIGVCLNNVAQTISNGVIAPIPYATVALCTPGSTASNCIANKVSIFTSTALSTATPTNPFTADAGGNYFFCAAVGHYGVLISSSYGTFFVNDVALVDDWSKGGTMTGALTDAFGFVGNASTASALAATPTACNPASYFSYGIAANGNALCNALPTPATVYYQTIQAAGTPLTQQPVLNFDSTIAATNGTGATNVGLPAVGTSGTYAYPVSVTTDAQGRVSAVTGGTVSNGWTSNGSTCNVVTGCWTKDPLGHIHQWGHLTSESGGACNVIAFPIAFTTAASIVPGGIDDFASGSSIQHSITTNSAHGCAAPTTTTMQDWESSGGNGVWWTADGY
jgi:hypothetical protein